MTLGSEIKLSLQTRDPGLAKTRVGLGADEVAVFDVRPHDPGEHDCIPGNSARAPLRLNLLDRLKIKRDDALHGGNYA